MISSCLSTVFPNPLYLLLPSFFMFLSLFIVFVVLIYSRLLSLLALLAILSLSLFYLFHLFLVIVLPAIIYLFCSVLALFCCFFIYL